jgi:hypothetical protein
VQDVEKDMIMRKLASEVEKNYEELLNGLRQLNQTDLDLARAIIDVSCCIRCLPVRSCIDS